MTTTGAPLLLLGGRPVPVAPGPVRLPPLRVDEATPLAFSFPPGGDGRLSLAGVPVPFTGGAADPAWVEESRREQWVGELDLELVVDVAGAGRAVRLTPRVVVLPKRATLEGFAFLVAQFRGWAGAGVLADPGGRARIWAELAPRVPRREEERALVALALLRRAVPALVAIQRAPATTTTERREWASLARTSGRRLLLRRLHPYDPPRPPEAPRSGQVATMVATPGPDREENRFVAGTVRRLLAMAGAVGEAPAWIPEEQRSELACATRVLAALGARAPWRDLPSGPAPRVSFLLRDHPHYRVFRTVADALDDSLAWSPLPGDPAALGLRTQTLNAIFEVWVAQATRAAVRRRLGQRGPLPAPLPRGGAEEAGGPAGRVRVGFDRVYPRHGQRSVSTADGPAAAGEPAEEQPAGGSPMSAPGPSHGGGAITALTRKRSPDVSVEWWGRGDARPVVLALDATWSRNPTYHDDKLGYARSLAAGDADGMLGTPRLVVRRSVVVFPGPRPEVHELGFALSLATVSAPPSEAGWDLLGAFLDRALDDIVPAGMDAGRFRPDLDLRPR